MKKTKKVKKISEYVVSLKNAGQVFVSKGKTFIDAISGIELRHAKGVGVLVVKKDDKVLKERILPKFIIQQLFGIKSQTMKEIADKRFKELLGDL